tara:strand:+ start:453 stop:608 length:156 start_codon:yes stop_codon:yes gene_type:complete
LITEEQLKNLINFISEYNKTKKKETALLEKLEREMRSDDEHQSSHVKDSDC